MRIEILAKQTERISRLFCLVGLAGLIGLAFATVADVLMRWLFNAPITGVRDTASLFVAVVIACAFPISLIKRAHIVIGFIRNLLGPGAKIAVTVFGHLVSLLIFALIAWQLWIYTDQLAVEKETTFVLGWPVAPWWRGLSIIMAFCVPVQLLVLFQSFRLRSSGGDRGSGIGPDNSETPGEQS